MDNSSTCGDYYKDTKLRRVDYHFLSRVDKIINWERIDNSRQ